MDCDRVQNLLSAYHDGEIDGTDGQQVADHLKSCVECRAALDAIEQLSSLAAQAASPRPPDDHWPRIERRLEAPPPARSEPSRGLWWRQRRFRAAGLLMTVAAALAVMFLVRGPAPPHRHDSLDLSAFLDAFDANPASASQMLVGQFEGRTATRDEIAREARYRPVATDGLPRGFGLEAMYLLRMPCCLCVQTVYQDDAGKTLVLFEHVDKEPARFGDRPMVSARCGGKPTCLVQSGERLAASWKTGERQLTLVGVEDLQDVAAIMSHLEHDAVVP